MATLLLDVDGVVADMMGTLHDVLTERGYQCPKHDEVTCWDFLTLIKDEDSKAYAQIVLSKRWFWASLKPYDGAFRFVDAIRQEGHDVVFLTAPYDNCPEWHDARVCWLREHMGASSRDVVVTHEKWRVRGHVFIDDKPDNAVTWDSEQESMLSIGFLLERPWNATGQRKHCRTLSSLDAGIVLRHMPPPFMK